MGSDFVVIGSDMPHQDEAAHDDLVGEFEVRRKDLGDEFMAKLLCGNAARLYGLDPRPMARQV